MIKKIAVVGGGTMGLGIAQTFAMAGFETLLFDIDAVSLANAQQTIKKNLAIGVQKNKFSATQMDDTLALLSFSNELSAVVADLVVEAIVERLEVKINLFGSLSLQNSDLCIFGSNTSSLSITKMAAGIPNPERVIGIHFFNPAHLMRLVEVISGSKTSSVVAQSIFDLCQKIGKYPVMVRDTPGFIVNRVARSYYTESLKTLEEGVADIKTIDRLLENAGFAMGAFRLMDTIGNDVNLAVTKSLFEGFFGEPRFRPSRLQQQKVDAGLLGKKTGEGFYKYD